jgi:hypothetical protein
MKDIDTAHRLLLLKAYCACFPLMALLGWVTFGKKGIWIAAVVCLFVSFGAVALAGRIGKAAGGLYRGRRPDWNTQERYAADLSRARVQKMSGNYAEALRIVETVLADQPALNPALFLKAQILAEGFDHRLEAQNCLVKIFQTEPKHSQLYQWSAGLYKKLADTDASAL